MASAPRHVGIQEVGLINQFALGGPSVWGRFRFV
jgi:hypothetical protein